MVTTAGWRVDGIINNGCHPFRLSGRATSHNRPRRQEKHKHMLTHTDSDLWPFYLLCAGACAKSSTLMPCTTYTSKYILIHYGFFKDKLLSYSFQPKFCLSNSEENFPQTNSNCEQLHQNDQILEKYIYSNHFWSIQKIKMPGNDHKHPVCSESILQTHFTAVIVPSQSLHLPPTAGKDWNIPCLWLIWLDGQFHYNLSQSLEYAYVCERMGVCAQKKTSPSVRRSSC